MMIHDSDFAASAEDVLARIRSRQYQGVIIRFVDKAVRDEVASRDVGTPIFVTMPMVNIRQAGDKHSNFFAPADTPFLNVPDLGRHVTYSEFFAEEWAAYSRKQAVAVYGAPTENLPGITAGQVATLKAMNILTLEQLVGVSPKSLKPLGMMGSALQERARSYLASAREGAPSTALATEVAELRAQLAQLLQATNPKSHQPVESDDGDTQDEEDGAAAEFASWDAERLREFIVASGEPKPRADCSMETLRKRAEAIRKAERS